jgi:two-component system cell cycle response regulator DivK
MTEETVKRPNRILVVDDNRDNRELVVKVLARHGYEILEAENGEKALEMVAGQPPDLILMDISLPGLNGYEVTRRLKKRLDSHHIPIIALTAHAMKGDREKALASGCCDYLAKPIDIRELQQLVARRLA